MRGTHPFSDASDHEVRIRVAYRLIELEYRRLHFRPEYAADYIFLLAHDMDRARLDDLAMWLRAFGFHISRGLRIGYVKSTMVVRVRAGMNFRIAALWTYKVTRRDPRVTNRGVRGTDTQQEVR